MSKTKILRPFSDSIAVIIQRGGITDTGAYATPSSMYDLYAHIIDYM